MNVSELISHCGAQEEHKKSHYLLTGFVLLYLMLYFENLLLVI